MFTKNRGFTLIELLVVVSIIGVLSSTTLVAVQSTKNKAKETKNFVELKQFMTALDMYKLDNGSYPGAFNTYYVSSQNGVSNNCNRGNGTLWTEIFDANFTTKYMSKLPTEIQPCGIIYVKYSADNSGNPPITCKTYFNSPTDYNEGEYEYFLVLMTDSNGIYKDLGFAIWQYAGAPSASSDQKCIPGPHK